jgi:hypothetical protein
VNLLPQRGDQPTSFLAGILMTIVTVKRVGLAIALSIGLLGVAMVTAQITADAAEYRDPRNVFAFKYDDTVWVSDIDANGDFGLQCKPEACQGAISGCYVNTQRVLLGSVDRIMKSFDPERIAQEQIEAFAEQKAELEKSVASNVTWDKAADVAPQLVAPYAPRRIAGHPVLQAEFRMSMAGQAARYVSYLTAAGTHSIAVVCHASEGAIAEWRPRFEALMAAFDPAPNAKKTR